MGFKVEQECPQCGAPLVLDETDHLLCCPYCNVKSFLYTPSHFRFALPHKSTGREILYAPYLRFKGNVFSVQGQTLHHRIVDITRLGMDFKGIPPSLGLRPQVMKMRFVTPETGGRFLCLSLRPSQILNMAANLSSPSSNDRLYHRAYIGETLSLIYLPLFVEKNKIHDAVLDRAICGLSESPGILEAASGASAGWTLTFVSALCPQCGWNLEGERDSVVLICRNCETAWEVEGGSFRPVDCSAVPGERENTLYLPFWKIFAAAKEIDIHSYADFIRVTNQPRAVLKKWENQNMSFWTPAFKIRPKVFLDLSRQYTLFQDEFNHTERIGKKPLYPVTLPRSEAAQTMKLTLATSAIHKNSVYPHLPRIRFEIHGSFLMYLPFTGAGGELIQQGLGISIQKKILEFGRSL